MATQISTNGKKPTQYLIHELTYSLKEIRLYPVKNNLFCVKKIIVHFNFQGQYQRTQKMNNS